MWTLCVIFGGRWKGKQKVRIFILLEWIRQEKKMECCSLENDVCGSIIEKEEGVNREFSGGNTSRVSRKPLRSVHAQGKMNQWRQRNEQCVLGAEVMRWGQRGNPGPMSAGVLVMSPSLTFSLAEARNPTGGQETGEIIRLEGHRVYSNYVESRLKGRPEKKEIQQLGSNWNNRWMMVLLLDQAQPGGSKTLLNLPTPEGCADEYAYR